MNGKTKSGTFLQWNTTQANKQMKKEHITDSQNNIDESQVHYAKWKKMQTQRLHSV